MDALIHVAPTRVTILHDGGGDAAIARYLLESEPELRRLAARERSIATLSSLAWGPAVMYVVWLWVGSLTAGWH